jgi:hypothetical protein
MSCKPVRQGDVYLHPATIPTDAKRVSPTDGRYLLALGESSGHAHVLEATPEVELYEKDGTLYVRTLAPVELKHLHLPTNSPTQDHNAGVVSPGERVLRIQQECTPDGVVRPVID